MKDVYQDAPVGLLFLEVTELSSDSNELGLKRIARLDDVTDIAPKLQPLMRLVCKEDQVASVQFDLGSPWGRCQQVHGTGLEGQG